jgi:2,4-dienoyl-CoA reductase-like NADH-dependent reductase (Old Yellow Enzyme family)
MPMLFTPIKLGNLEIKNRMIASATTEAMATPEGEVTERYIKRYQQLAKGGVGLSITGSLFVHPLGKGGPALAGIHNDRMIPGLKKTTDVVHEADGKIAFQLSHTGRQVKPDLNGQAPLGPSDMKKDPMFGAKAQAMTEVEIREMIDSFVQAAARAGEAGADAVEIMAGHGYLVNQFLSPFFNHRVDSWGGSPENQFRFLKEIILEIKKTNPGLPVLVKLNINDYTPDAGITLPLAVQYTQWLAELEISGLEITSGTVSYSFMNSYRGDVPLVELLGAMPIWKRPLNQLIISKNLVGKYPCDGEYHLDAAAIIKPAIGNIPLILVGGVRNRQRMDEILRLKQADILSMGRPFIREPMLSNQIMAGRTGESACASCNKCLAYTTLYNRPVQCYAARE